MNAIVTGASKGIGKAIAFALAKEGYHLFINSTKQPEINKVAKEITLLYPNIIVKGIAADVSTKEGIAHFVQAINSEAIDVLINNAGRYLPGALHTEEDGTLENMIATNLYSAYYVTKGILPKMLPHNKGFICNICSVAGLQAYANGGSYSISKFALIGFTKNLREEMKAYNIKVTSISPGATWSNSWAGVDLPVDRLMQADDIAKTIISMLHLSPSAVVEDIVMRPMLGDL